MTIKIELLFEPHDDEYGWYVVDHNEETICGPYAYLADAKLALRQAQKEESQ